MLEWNDRYATGDALVDDQHKKIFQIVNKFEEQVKAGTAEENIENTLKFLGTYVQTHFSYEEGCMNKHKCPVAEQNKQAHAQFLQDYATFQARFSSEGYTDILARTLLKITQEWLLKHICGIDVHLKHCLSL